MLTGKINEFADGESNRALDVCDNCKEESSMNHYHITNDARLGCRYMRVDLRITSGQLTRSWLPFSFTENLFAQARLRRYNDFEAKSFLLN